MLVNLNDVLTPAGGYAVGLFNTVNLEMARGVLAAAEEQNAPVIIGTAEVLLPYGPLEELSCLLLPMARRAKVPVVVHLDHGLHYETCRRALELGFTSVMYDCSTDPYEENVRKVREMVELAHSYGATVEAELGHVGDNPAEGSAPVSPEACYTSPEEARDFVEKTGVDALAVAVGTAHGAYRFPPKLDFDRISRIAQAMEITLPTVTVAVKRLEKKGYVVKNKDENDGRVTRVALTARGRKMDAAHRYFHENMVRSITREMSEAEVEELVRILSKLNRYLERKQSEMSEKQ